MKKLFILALMALALTGCSTVKGWIPSFWDDNQSAKMADLRVHVSEIDCDALTVEAVQRVQTDLLWFDLYSESKGWRQADVRRLIAPMQETVKDFLDRTRNKPGSKTYCQMKKQIMTDQAARASAAVLGRF